MKRVMMLTTTVYMNDKFNKDNILILKKLGYQVDIVTNFQYVGAHSKEAMEDFKKWLISNECNYYSIDINRSPFKIFSHLRAFRQLLEITRNNKYSFIHCHNPVGGVIGRLVAHKEGVKIIYTAHGFHFFKGGPIKNWILYYPVEKFLSRWTDLLITINREDYLLAKKKFNAKKIKYIPGVGIDLESIRKTNVGADRLKEKFGVEDKFVFLSAGELQKIKNHMLILKAINSLKRQKWQNLSKCVFLFAGNGGLLEKYKKYCNDNDLNDYVKFLGYRKDVYEIMEMADCFIHPSTREGLGLAALEAMAKGKAIISSRVNGMKDYIAQGVTGLVINPRKVASMSDAIKKMYMDEEFRKQCGINNKKIAINFSKKRTNRIMEQLYKDMGNYD